MSEEYKEVVDTGVEETQVEGSNEEYEYVDLLTDDGTFSEEWRNSLPDDLGKHSIWQKYTTPEDLAKGAIHSQSLTGKKLQELMESDDPEMVQQRNEVLGVPDSADEYELYMPEGHEITEADEESLSEFAEVAHALNLSNEQANALIEYETLRNQMSGEQAEINSELVADNAEAELREVWTGDDYDYNLSRVAECLDFLDLGHLKDDPKLGNDPQFIMALHEKIVPLIQEDAIIASKNESAATIEDQLVEVESRMHAHPNNHDSEYQLMTKEYGVLLQKKAKLQY